MYLLPITLMVNVKGNQLMKILCDRVTRRPVVAVARFVKTNKPVKI